MINCIQQRNPSAGFLSSHTRFCSRCEEDATHHRNHDGCYCENLCEHCATETKERKRVLKAGVEVGIFVVETNYPLPTHWVVYL